MVSRGLIGNLGDPGRSPVMGVVADKPKRGGSHDDALEVGPTHRRGVVRVMSGASRGSLEGVGSYTQSEGETPTMHRNGDWVQTKLKLITSRAQRDRGWRFTTLAYLLDEGFLAQCFMELKRRKAPGIDGGEVGRIRGEAYGESAGACQSAKGEAVLATAGQAGLYPKG